MEALAFSFFDDLLRFVNCNPFDGLILPSFLNYMLKWIFAIGFMSQILTARIIMANLNDLFDNLKNTT